MSRLISPEARIWVKDLPPRRSLVDRILATWPRHRCLHGSQNAFHLLPDSPACPLILPFPGGDGGPHRYRRGTRVVVHCHSPVPSQLGNRASTRILAKPLEWYPAIPIEHQTGRLNRSFRLTPTAPMRRAIPLSISPRGKSAPQAPLVVDEARRMPKTRYRSTSRMRLAPAGS